MKIIECLDRDGKSKGFLLGHVKDFPKRMIWVAREEATEFDEERFEYYWNLVLQNRSNNYLDIKIDKP